MTAFNIQRKYTLHCIACVCDKGKKEGGRGTLGIKERRAKGEWLYGLGVELIKKKTTWRAFRS